jgi:chromosome segregation ATPase
MDKDSASAKPERLSGIASRRLTDPTEEGASFLMNSMDTKAVNPATRSVAPKEDRRDERQSSKLSTVAQQAVENVDSKCKHLQDELASAHREIADLRKQYAIDTEKADSMREKLMLDFHDKEARLLQAVSEENDAKILQVEQKLQHEVHSLEEYIATERRRFIEQEESYRQLVEKSESRAEKAEAESQSALRKQESQLSHAQQREHQALQIAEDKVAQTMAILDEREADIAHLKALVKSLESSMDDHADGAEEAHQEVVELQTENDSLQQYVDNMEAECAVLKDQVARLEVDAEKLGGIQVSVDR